MVVNVEDVGVIAEEGGGAPIEVEPLREAVEEIEGDRWGFGVGGED